MKSEQIVWGRTQDSIDEQHKNAKARYKGLLDDKKIDRDEYNDEMTALVSAKMAAEDRITHSTETVSPGAGEDLADGASHEMQDPPAQNAASEAGLEEMITPAQLRYLGTLTSAWDDLKLRTWLSDGWKVVSRRDLSKVQASEAISVAKDFNDAPDLVDTTRPLVPKQSGKKQDLFPAAKQPSRAEPAKQKDQDTFLQFENRDESQIMHELQGGMLDEFIYSFKESGRTVTGLSWAGVKECARRMGGIEVLDADIVESVKEFRVIVRAKDTKTQAVMLGVSAQAKIIETKSGRRYEDKFALQKAVSKAQRNAIRCLIPEAFVKQMITKMQKVRE